MTFGLPEVNLGVVPSAGGAQRLPRLTGIKIALEIIASPRTLNAREALEAAIVDETAVDAARVAWPTAWRMITTRAAVKAGETVSIFGVGGSVALAALEDIRTTFDRLESGAQFGKIGTRSPIPDERDTARIRQAAQTTN